MLVNPYRFNATPVPPVDTPFIIKVNSDAFGKFIIKTHPSPTYDYNLATSDGQTILNQTGDYEITFPNSNTDYIIEITGVFPHMYNWATIPENQTILDVLQWGNQPWASMFAMFKGCFGLSSFSATDTPDLSNVTNMSYMFQFSSFNGGNGGISNIGNWDVSNVTHMHFMFNQSSFNGDIGNWDVGNVTNMNDMFGSTPFNQDIGNWDVSSVTSMNGMLNNATSFNQDLSSWCVQNIPSEPINFDGATVAWILPKPAWGTCPP